MRSVRTATLAACVGLCACGFADEESNPSTTFVKVGAEARITPTTAAPAAELHDSHGRRWLLNKTFSAWNPGRPSYYKDVPDEASVADAMTDEELAAALRPARLHGNAEYLLDISLAEMTERLRTARADGKSGKSSARTGPLDVARTFGGAPSAPLSPAPAPLEDQLIGSFSTHRLTRAEGFGDRSEKGSARIARRDDARGDETAAFLKLGETGSLTWNPTEPTKVSNVVGGTDTRYFINHSQVWNPPRKSAIVQAEWLSGAGVLNGAVCSANLIGIYTAVSAAHCFWDRFAASPYPQWPIANGVVSTGSRAGGTWLIENQTRVGAVQVECYDRYYPSGWTATFSWDFDYGVIEFGCGLPGSNGNYILATNPATSLYASKAAFVDAYDAILVDENTGNDYGPYADPSLRSRTDTGVNAVTLHTNPRLLQTTRIDVTFGASGGCVRQQLYNSSFYCSGVVSHGNSTQNFFRRLDADFMTFINSFSEY